MVNIPNILSSSVIVQSLKVYPLSQVGSDGKVHEACSNWITVSSVALFGCNLCTMVLKLVPDHLARKSQS